MKRRKQGGTPVWSIHQPACNNHDGKQRSNCRASRHSTHWRSSLRTCCASQGRAVPTHCTSLDAACTPFSGRATEPVCQTCENTKNGNQGTHYYPHRGKTVFTATCCVSKRLHCAYKLARSGAARSMAASAADTRNVPNMWGHYCTRLPLTALHTKSVASVAVVVIVYNSLPAVNSKQAAAADALFSMSCNMQSIHVQTPTAQLKHTWKNTRWMKMILWYPAVGRTAYNIPNRLRCCTTRMFTSNSPRCPAHQTDTHTRSQDMPSRQQRPLSVLRSTQHVAAAGPSAAADNTTEQKLLL
jgi:hypothetical protein